VRITGTRLHIDVSSRHNVIDRAELIAAKSLAFTINACARHVHASIEGVALVI
jgi:hypothetical protein